MHTFLAAVVRTSRRSTSRPRLFQPVDHQAADRQATGKAPAHDDAQVGVAGREPDAQSSNALVDTVPRHGQARGDRSARATAARPSCPVLRPVIFVFVTVSCAGRMVWIVAPHDSRITSLQSNRMSRGGSVRSSIRWIIAATAARPIARHGCRMVVNGTVSRLAYFTSSMPTTATSCGTWIPSFDKLCSRLAAVKSLRARNACGAGPISSRTNSRSDGSPRRSHVASG